VDNHFRRILLIAIVLAGVLSFSSCNRSRMPAAKRYPFTGRVVSIDTQAESAIIDADPIPGFMDAMAMSYKVKPATILSHLTPGDSISADMVVVQPDARNADAAPDYWLENLKVVGHVNSPPAAAASSPHIPEPGEEVPDFSLTDQSNKRISLQQFRGGVLFVTFIYTRCPFPDFCPRMSGNFVEIYKQVSSNPSLAGSHLLSISFDPEHDTPKILRDYGFSVAHTHDPKLFKRWTFAAPRAADLPKLADFFALTIKPEGGLITHNLSTIVIGPDGKIVKWYRGGDWQVSDLMKDAVGATAVGK
jgi:protein SCO1/2